MNIIEQLSFKTEGYQIVNITEKIQELVILHEFKKGLVNLSIQHTSASLTVQENASQDVLNDIRTFLSNLAPDSSNYLHDVEGPDDMPAHIKTVLIGSDLTIPLRKGKLVLGTWQGIYLCEHRNHGGARTVTITLNGE